MSDDLKRDIVFALRTYAMVDSTKGPQHRAIADEIRRIISRLEAAEVREPSRLERVRAALPEGDDWSAERRPYSVAVYYKDWRVFVLADESPLTPEEAVEAAKKLAGVEERR